MAGARRSGCDLDRTRQTAQYFSNVVIWAMLERGPCLFLSHSGADTDAARELKRRLLDSSDARSAGLRVWLDKDNLSVGAGWQAQLEKAITEEATAFAVHVGGKGVINWVESEVRLGLSRATGASDYPFIPILAKECAGSTALPPFARQYQGVHDPLNNPEEFAKLLRAVLRRSPGGKAIALESPFVGLKAMTETDADRFFGRSEEIAELVAMLKQRRLIAIVADSGAGKSSLAQAGLIPAFRGGALSDTAGREPDNRLWHVVVMRPRRDPIEGLRRGVTEAAERLGRSAEQCAALRRRINPADPSATAYAIRCDLPVGKTETLLIVDQFEELLTETGEAQRAPFVDLLVALEAAGGFRVVLTLRADHFNLCRPFSKLFEHLTRNSHEAVLRLRRITDDGIIEAVRNPLRLAGHTDISEQNAVIDSIRRDITDRAGDLALVQMALYAMWQKHRADGVNLLIAYSQVGGVVGALAHEAEHVRTQRLDATERASLGPLFIRLVRLGETGGATRRAADLTDFAGPRRVLAARLATEDCGRLLLAGERTVEIAHEALITQWPWLQNTLNEAAMDMRVFDRLMDKARRWNTTGSRDSEHLATGAERAEFAALAEHRSDWLSTIEREFVTASEEAERAIRKDREAQLLARAKAQRRARLATIIAACTASFLTLLLLFAVTTAQLSRQNEIERFASFVLYGTGPQFRLPLLLGLAGLSRGDASWLPIKTSSLETGMRTALLRSPRDGGFFSAAGFDPKQGKVAFLHVPLKRIIVCDLALTRFCDPPPVREGVNGEGADANRNRGAAAPQDYVYALETPELAPFQSDKTNPRFAQTRQYSIGFIDGFNEPVIHWQGFLYYKAEGGWQPPYDISNSLLGLDSRPGTVFVEILDGGLRATINDWPNNRMWITRLMGNPNARKDAPLLSNDGKWLQVNWRPGDPPPAISPNAEFAGSISSQRRQMVLTLASERGVLDYPFATVEGSLISSWPSIGFTYDSSVMAVLSTREATFVNIADNNYSHTVFSQPFDLGTVGSSSAFSLPPLALTKPDTEMSRWRLALTSRNGIELIASGESASLTRSSPPLLTDSASPFRVLTFSKDGGFLFALSQRFDASAAVVRVWDLRASWSEMVNSINRSDLKKLVCRVAAIAAAEEARDSNFAALTNREMESWGISQQPCEFFSR
jgi:Novel STAND NTPase 1/TIR domain